jgi:uncharacterized protein (DUF1697 family)
MALVVFLRGVNVGGHKTFRPSVLAQELTGLDVASVGAAGTFVVRGTNRPATLRAALLERLTFDAEFVICRDREVLGLMSEDPFPAGKSAPDVKRYVSILAGRRKADPPLPLTRPEGDAWQVKVVAIREPFVLSLHRRQEGALVYPNEVVEKQFSVSATTRNWSTIAAVCALLQPESR